ncbi:hypothetical protein C5Y96_22700 [Blastopirellula marina]|uniref:Hydrogenase maturation factor HypA n=1 Tax=Blastopirellula marina TaxID=124 RepID=A0A2S8F1M7_9BACT|nr:MULTISPECIES: hydrogenase maturation nickel metallochaperone HypA [Pirellulaceae]PQO25824.1 hypothetical protein C5Y96_22700 [Blastopirellula marina]RCS43507.1 hydrogenase maturation nickel metallochaperone HypA [Bremerella cremea]
MHERSLAQALLNQIAEIANAHPASKVVVIRISIGLFSGVEPELFRMALETMVPDSPYHDAKIEMGVVEIEAHCPQCDHRFPVKAFSFTCPRCGGQDTSVVQGEDLVLESLVLEEEASCPTTT